MHYEIHDSSSGTRLLLLHRFQHGRPFIDAPALADAIDAEVVEPADKSDPAREPESPESAMPYPGAGDDGDRDMPTSTGLMTLEKAAEAVGPSELHLDVRA